MKSLIQKGFLLAVYTLLYFPIFVLILYSFNDTRFSLQWHGFSFQWYSELFHDLDLWSSFLHSILLGISAALIATVMGTLTCVLLYLHPARQLNRPLHGMLLLLIIIPDLVLGVALLILFNLLPIYLGFWTLLIAHVTFCIPFVILTINPRLKTLDTNLYFSAIDLGASRFKALKSILLPLLWPAIVSSLLLCFTLSFDDIIISYFVAGPDFNILPLTIYSLVRVGVTPELNALCTFTLLMTMVLVVAAHILSKKKYHAS